MAVDFYKKIVNSSKRNHVDSNPEYSHFITPSTVSKPSTREVQYFTKKGEHFMRIKENGKTVEVRKLASAPACAQFGYRTVKTNATATVRQKVTFGYDKTTVLSRKEAYVARRKAGLI